MSLHDIMFILVKNRKKRKPRWNRNRDPWNSCPRERWL